MTPTLTYLAPALARIHPGWHELIHSPALQAALADLDAALQQQAARHTIYPPPPTIFHALSYCAPADVRVVILGQDPYHGAGEACGMAFSVPRGIRVPPSLRNVYKELEADLGIPVARHGDLSSWARQGVLLLNTVMTVEADQAGSHRKLGWQGVTDALIQALSDASGSRCFLLWGKDAAAKQALLDARRHHILLAPHPSPLAAHRGFFGSRHFSASNAFLLEHGVPAIDWSITD